MDTGRGQGEARGRKEGLIIRPGAGEMICVEYSVLEKYSRWYEVIKVISELAIMQ